MYQVILKKTPRDQDYPDRYYPLMIYSKILHGTLYDCFVNAYHTEYLGSQTHPTYVPEVERAPCINTGMNLMRSVVEQSVGFLYGEDRFPTIMIEDETTKEWADNIVKDTHLIRVFQDAVTKGSIGSVAIHLKVLQNRFFPVVHETIYLTPEFDRDQPDRLTSIIEKKKTLGADLRAAGYTIDDDDLDAMFWFQRTWDEQEEIWYRPWKCGAQLEDKFRMTRDEKRSVVHGLGLVPWVWIRNLVGMDHHCVDGRCTFEPAIENCIQIDYQLSRVDKSLKYNCDPLTVLKVRNPNQIADFVRGDGNALVIGVEGDAKILEISSDAAAAILNVVEELKDEAMQSIHGSRADPDKLATSQSSVAQRMLFLPMVQLASHLRISYGDGGLLPLLKMMMTIAAKLPIKVLGKVGKKPDPMQDITLAYSDFFPMTPFDVQLQSQSLITLVQAGILSKETALANLRKFIDIDNMNDELARIKSEQDVDQQREIDTQTAIIKAKPAPASSSNVSRSK